MPSQDRRNHARPQPDDRRAERRFALLLSANIAMMGFSAVSAWLGQPALAALAGSACVSLSYKLARVLS